MGIKLKSVTNVFVLGLFLFSGFAFSAVKSPGVSKFITDTGKRVPAAARIFDSYHHEMVSRCHYEPSVNELKRLVIFSDLYVDLLAYLSIAYDELAYQQLMNDIPCNHGQLLLKHKIPEKYKDAF